MGLFTKKQKKGYEFSDLDRMKAQIKRLEIQKRIDLAEQTPENISQTGFNPTQMMQIQALITSTMQNQQGTQPNSMQNNQITQTLALMNALKQQEMSVINQYEQFKKIIQDKVETEEYEDTGDPMEKMFGEFLMNKFSNPEAPAQIPQQNKEVAPNLPVDVEKLPKPEGLAVEKASSHISLIETSASVPANPDLAKNIILDLEKNNPMVKMYLGRIKKGQIKDVNAIAKLESFGLAPDTAKGVLNILKNG